MKSALVLFITATFLSIVAIADEPKGMPENVREELNRIVGTWTGDLSAGEQKASATFEAKWSDSNDAIIWHWTAPLISTTDDAGKFVVKGTGLMGWDADAKQITELSFNNLSETISRSYKIESDGKWVGSQSGTYRSDDMKKHVPMKGKMSISFSSGSLDFKESSEYEGELFRDVSLTMRRK